MSAPATVERRIVTVLFADLVGFTPLSERLDAEDVAAIQDAYFAAVRETVARHGGALEKFIGDAAMAVFGLDRAHDDDAERAVRTGLALAGAVERLGGQLGLDPGELQLRVGIESGEVVSAEAGPDQGRVTGDVVNTAARLQSAAPPGGVLLGEGAVLAAAAAVELEPTTALALKGKAEPVRASLAVGLRPEPTREAAMGALRASMVGREGELDRLRGALAEAAQGRSVAMIVVAPPGTGKSRLLAEFLAGAPATTVWRSRVRADAGASIEPIVALARTALADLTPQEVERRLAPDVAPARAQVLGDAIRALAGIDDGASEGIDRESRFAAWIEALDGLAGPEPVMWAIEDIHWASGDVLAFLAAAARAPTRCGRLIVASARPSVAERLDPVLARLELQRLPPADAGRLVVELVGNALPPDLVAAIEERSDGNPLFIEELLRTWVAVGTLVADEGTWRLTRAPGTVTLPSTVQAIYAGQLDDLPRPVRDVARRASVAGRRFPADALEVLGAEAPARGVEGLLGRALVSGPIPDPVTGPGYAYRHALLRDAGYNSLGRADRARLHVRLAAWLESVAGARSDEIADRIGGHYEVAVASAPALATEVDDGLPRAAVAERAATWLERAADATLAQGAHDAAADLLRRALAQTIPADGADAARRTLGLAQAVGASGDMDEALRLAVSAEASYRTACRAAPGGSSAHAVARDGYARATDARARIVLEQLHFLEARSLAEATLADLGERRDVPWARVRLRAAIARGYFDDDFDIEAAQEVLAVARRDGDANLELDALDGLATWSVESLEAQLDRFADLAFLAGQQRRWDTVTRALRVQGGLMPYLGRDPWPALDRAADVAIAHGLREHLAWAEYSRAEIGFLLGDWDTAWAAGQRALGLAEANAYHRVAVRTWFALVPIAGARGDLGTMERAGRWLVDHAADFPDSPYGRLMHCGVDVSLSGAGLTAPVEVELDHLLVSFDQDVDGAAAVEAVWLVISDWVERGRLDDARTALDHIRAGFERFRTTGLVEGAADLLEGRLGLAQGSPTAGDAIRAGLALERAMNAPWWVRRALRLLEAAGLATAVEIGEAEALEARLGVVRRDD